jgi:hypothetical protein
LQEKEEKRHKVLHMIKSLSINFIIIKPMLDSLLHKLLFW